MRYTRDSLILFARKGGGEGGKGGEMGHCLGRLRRTQQTVVSIFTPLSDWLLFRFMS